MQNNIAIIPARIGSKRIKKKNIKLFNSRPIIEWTFKILKSSKLFNKIILTSDNTGILNLGKKLGFDILIKRPKYLADNFTGTEEVIKHSIDIIEQKQKINNVCCVYPCNPFIQIKDLKTAINKLKKKKNFYIFPVTNYSHPIERAYFLKNKNEIKYLNSSFADTRTQDLIEKFYDTGQFYFASRNTWLNLKNAKKFGIKIPNWRVIDIDNQSDWEKAELMYKFFKRYKVLKLI
jgi:pseudaminic acid cytidylyltransferase|tara:strand:- start:739 stop:1440 length:702 start_codon:yes stop_codon:yes gene_type:complete